jgi:hypothetical protein
MRDDDDDDAVVVDGTVSGSVELMDTKDARRGVVVASGNDRVVGRAAIMAMTAITMV